MKPIEKLEEPFEYLNWKNNDRMAHRRNRNRVPADIKRIVHQRLMQEQGFICCYCEASVTVENSHVEHFRPRNRFPEIQLEYENLHCSCQREQRRGEPRHCGHKKGGWFCEQLLMSPLDPVCEETFLFTGNGEMQPRRIDDQAARTTIDKLGLNIDRMQSLREAAIDALYDLTPDEVRELLQIDESGSYVSYHSAIAQVLLN